MNSTFAMWRRSLSQLIMMKEKRDWDALDLLSKWFIATRSAVGTVTLYSGLIGGVVYVLTAVWSWAVILASRPVGLNVVTINVGKQTDKLREDKVKKVRTLPVLVGETAARFIIMAAIGLRDFYDIYLIY